MTVDVLSRTSPLADRMADLNAVSHSDLHIAEIPFTTAVDVRVDRASAAAARIAARFCPLPCANTARTVLDRAILWLGPDEWLFTGPDGDGPVLAQTLRTALGEHPGSVVDVSANRTTIELRGRNARAVLEQGCALDLHPRAFHRGCCAQTLVGKAQVILWQTDNEPAYRLLVRNSFAGYLADWLLAAAA